LHPPGKPSVDRAEHLKDIKIPTLFIQGTRDKLAEWSLTKNVINNLSQATLCKIEGADHAFKAGKQNLIPTLAMLTSLWIKTLSS
jgi:predicted alpha/beta-hydrolase family hydrolase